MCSGMDLGKERDTGMAAGSSVFEGGTLFLDAMHIWDADPSSASKQKVEPPITVNIALSEFL